MLRIRTSVLLAALALGTVGAAVPAFAIGLPPLPPVVPTGPVLPGAPLPPLPKPTLPTLPTLPKLPLPTLPTLPTLPKLPLPTLPTVPGLPQVPTLPQVPVFPSVPPPAAGTPKAAQGQLSYLAWGHYIDDGLGIGVAPDLGIPAPKDALPAPLPYDSTGYDTKDYALPRTWLSAADRAAAARPRQDDHGSLPWVLLGAGVGVAAAGTVIVRKRAS